MSNFSFKALEGKLEEAYGGPLPRRVLDTLQLAHRGHGGQFRSSRSPISRTPFIAHPVGTALLAINYFPAVRDHLEDDLETIACVALAHDLIEDTTVDRFELESNSGAGTRAHVEALTKPPAEVAGRSKETRNREFGDRIVEAGPTAVYIKLCDSMHNMSRPQSTPLKLYRKVVDKAANLYQPLLGRCPLGEKFGGIYAEALREAQENLKEEERYDKGSSGPATLEEAIAECVSASAGKVLEFHDITEILNRIWGAAITSVWEVRGKNSDILELVSTTGSDREAGCTKTLAVSDAPSILSKRDACRFGKDVMIDSGAVFSIPMNTSRAKSYVTVLEFAGSERPPWLTLDTAAITVQFLAHRLVVHDLKRDSLVMKEAARIGMRVDAELIAQTSLSVPDLLELDRWCHRCGQAVAVVEGLIMAYVQGGRGDGSLHRSVRVESRVKSPNSILRKMDRRLKAPSDSFRMLEDIAGVRAICPTQSACKELQKYIEEEGFKLGCAISTRIDQPIRDWATSPTAEGYRAVHLILEVDTPLSADGKDPVLCEVQLRTMFQDIWAALAHDIAYKEDSRDDAVRRQLLALADQLRSCEKIADGIFSDSMG